MTRRSQEIPIRPRYGILDANNDDDDPAAIRTRKTSTTTSSYTEIPFLAQYAGNDETPTANKSPLGKDDSLEDIDSGEEDDENTNSKDSSGEQGKTPRRPDSLHCDSTFPYELEGATSNEDVMRHFVAENHEAKLRAASPVAKEFGPISENTTPSTSAGILTRHFLQSNSLPEVDGNVLSDIEIETQYLATSVDNLIENLGNLLHSISSITADNVEVHKNSVNKLTDSLDANIKCMYTIMAKTEEITKSMRPTEQLGQRIREIKRLVDMLDNTM